MNHQTTAQSIIRGIVLSLFILSWQGSAQAYDCLLDTNGDGNADTNVDTTSSASSGSSSARVACGNSATAGISATAVGNGAKATGTQSLALGRVTQASAEFSTAIGSNAKATAAGAIALGANVVASKAHTMAVGVPIEVTGDDGTMKILVNEKSAGNAVRTLFNVICDTCTPGFRFNQLLPSNNTWNFRMLQSGNFSVDDPATMGKEAEFRSGGDLKIGGTLIQASSREIKKNIVEVNPAEVLDNIGALPIYQWTYRHNSDHIRHMGPMSEDFYALFGLGDTNKGIAGVDSSGVALAAIKSLQQANAELNERIRVLESKLTEIDVLKQQMAQVLTVKGENQFVQVVSD